MSLRARVSVVVTCFNQAHFLDDALESVLEQRYPAHEIIVVDDGSEDNTEEVAARWPLVRYIRQANSGLAAARNAGIAASRGDYVVFLDADDRLLPRAIEAGLRQFADHPECAFVAGSHRMIGFDGRALWDHAVGPEDDDLYCALLRRNFIAMHAAVMYQRLVFEAVGGFDARPYSTEDYDLYLRIARRYPVWWHTAIVAEYRRHSSNMTRNPARVLESGLLSLSSQRELGLDRKARRACRAGMRFLRRYYSAEIAAQVGSSLAARQWRTATKGIVALLCYQPQALWTVVSR